MFKTIIALLVTSIFINLAAAETNTLITVEIPSKSDLVSLEKIERRTPVSITPKIKDSSFQLPTGKYLYKINIAGSYELFEGQFELLPGQTQFFIHQQSSPDRETVYVFPSKHEKATTEYHSQYSELRCLSIFNFNLREKFVSTFADCEKLANDGSITAQQIVGNVYSDENSDSYNIEKAIKYLHMAYLAGNADAGNNLAFLHQKKGDLKATIDIVQKLAQKGNPRAQTTMAIYYLTGEGVEKDLAQAKTLLRKSAAQGHDFSFRMLSELALKQNSNTPDLIEALMWGIMYLRSSNMSSYSYDGIYNSVIGDMSQSQIRDAQQRASALAIEHQQFYQGRLCVPKKADLDPNIKNKKLQYKLNQYNELIDIHNETHSFAIVSIPSNRIQNEISFYVDNEFYFSKTVNMDSEYLLDKCVIYDKSIESHDLVNINANDTCDCFNK